MEVDKSWANGAAFDVKDLGLRSTESLPDRGDDPILDQHIGELGTVLTEHRPTSKQERSLCKLVGRRHDLLSSPLHQ